MMRSIVVAGLFATSTAGLLAAQPRTPKGIYTNFLLGDAVNQAQTAAYPNTPPSKIPPYPNPNITPDPTDAVLVNYFTTLLDNPAISGLAPMIPWQLLNPNSPGTDPAHPKPGAYAWNALDDVFTAVDNWNKSHPAALPKTIQIINSAGFNAPNWVFNDIDVSVCGSLTNGCGTCDGLFMSTSPASVPSQQCGYTTIFWATEGGAPRQIPLPLPWNSVYKADHQTFLTALNQRIQQEPSSSAFVSIDISGPTASSSEMILPNLENQSFTRDGVTNDSILTLPNNVPTIPNVDASAAWNILIGNFYGSMSSFLNTDQPFIQEWNNAIDLYGQIFSGVTLVLVTTTDALPDFHLGVGVPAPAPTPGFTSDCATAAKTSQQQCAAVTQVLQHYTNPTVGGSNAKAVMEAGMTAARDSVDLGTNGIRWLAAVTAAGSSPLPGTPYDMSRILGGLQFSHDVSPADTLQSEGCPAYPTPCPNLTPAQGLENVLQLSYFIGTAAAPQFGASTSVTYGNFAYADAPMNFLQIYAVDIIYALGLSNCSILQIAGSPANDIQPNVSVCSAMAPLGGFQSVLSTQEELDLASEELLSIAEPPSFGLTLTRVGSFTQGQSGAAFTISVRNNSNSASAGMATVTGILPTALTATAIDGPGWACVLATLTCSRSDSLAAFTSYPPIVVTVSVASNAATQVTNQASISGGTLAAATAYDTILIGAPFADVSSSDAFLPAIDLLLEYGITSGCGASPPTYCPNDDITRGQMAVFIVRSIFGGDNFTASTTPYFADVPSTSPYFQWIQKMRDLGITAGCTATTYCPDDQVTRGQMAVFIIRARYGSDAAFAYSSTPLFTDVPSGNSFFEWVQKMGQIGITSGCGTGIYCPNDSATREQMAVFVVRGAFNQLLPANSPVIVWASGTSAAAGQTLTVTVAGQNTSFVNAVTQVTFGDGIAVSNVSVANGTILTAQLAVSAGAVSGPRTIVVTTGSEEAALPNGFRVQ